MLSFLPCFPAFCYPYIIFTFEHLVYAIFCMLELKFAIYHRQASSVLIGFLRVELLVESLTQAFIQAPN